MLSLSRGTMYPSLPVCYYCRKTYDYCESFMANAATKFSGDEFITYDADAAYPYGFLKVGTDTTVRSCMLVLLYLPLLVVLMYVEVYM